MESAEAKIVRCASSQYNVVTRAQLLDADVTPNDIVRCHRRQLLVPTERPGVYGVGDPPSEPLARLRAATLAIPGSAAYRWTVAELRGFPIKTKLEPLEIVARRNTSNRLPWARVHQTAHLPGADVELVRGVPATTAARTVCDLAGWMSDDKLAWMVQRLLVDDVLDQDELLACFFAFARRGRKGSARMRRVLDGVGFDDEAVPESVLELDFIDNVLVPHRIRMTRQWRPPWYDGLRGVVDFVADEAPVIAETDGRRWHSTQQAIEDDRRRDRVAARHGFLVLRFGAVEVRRRPEEVAAELRSHIERLSGNEPGAGHRVTAEPGAGHRASDGQGPRLGS